MADVPRSPATATTGFHETDILKGRGLARRQLTRSRGPGRPKRPSQCFELYNYALLTIFLAGVVLLLAASEVGRRIGLHAAARGGGNVSTLESAVLGLMALMIGFTFAMALSRFETRRDAVLGEANAIGTTALRARLLPQPERGEALRLLQQYVTVRLAITKVPVSGAELAAAIDKSNEIPRGPLAAGKSNFSEEL